MSATKFAKCSFCRYIVFYAWRKKFHVRPDRKFLTVPNINGIQCTVPNINGVQQLDVNCVRQVSTTCTLFSTGRQDDHGDSSSSDSSSSDSDDETKVHRPGKSTDKHTPKGKETVTGHEKVQMDSKPEATHKHDSTSTKQTGSEKGSESRSSRKRKTLFTSDGTAEGEPMSRTKLDEAILEAAKSVAEELEGDTTQIQSDLISKLKQQTRVTAEQKMGKPPQPKTSPLDTLQAMAGNTDTDATSKEDLYEAKVARRKDQETAKKSSEKGTADKVVVPEPPPSPVKEKEVTISDVETNVLGDILKGMHLEEPEAPARMTAPAREGATPKERAPARKLERRGARQRLDEDERPYQEGRDMWEAQEPWSDYADQDLQREKEPQKERREFQREKQRLQRERQERQMDRQRQESRETWFLATGQYTNNALNIFSPEDLVNVAEPAGENRLFNMLKDKMDQEKFDLPVSNAFEEQIRWTKEGKLWKFPIDNEQGWEEEANVSFEEHIFLEDLLEDFPKKGPVRHFMELVTTALSKNPYLTVAQKHEHIDWFRQYFEEKKSVIEESLVSEETESLKQAN